MKKRLLMMRGTHVHVHNNREVVVGMLYFFRHLCLIGSESYQPTLCDFVGEGEKIQQPLHDVKAYKALVIFFGDVLR